MYFRYIACKGADVFLKYDIFGNDLLSDEKAVLALYETVSIKSERG